MKEVLTKATIQLLAVTMGSNGKIFDLENNLARDILGFKSTRCTELLSPILNMCNKEI